MKIPFEKLLTMLLLVAALNLPATQSIAQAEHWDYYAATDNVHDIALDGNTLWIASGTGLVEYDMQGDLLVNHYNLYNSDLPTNDIYAVEPDGSGGVWVGTAWNGLAHYNAGNWTLYNEASVPEFPGDQIWDLRIDQSGDLWVGFWGFNQEGVCQYDGTTWTFHNTGEVYNIASAPNGDIWVAAQWPGGLFQYDGSLWTEYNTSNSSIPTDNVRQVGVAPNGNVYVSTNGGGAGLVEYDGTLWTTYTTSNSSIPTNNLEGLTIDASGNVFIGSSNGGVLQFDGTTFTTHGAVRSPTSIAVQGNGDLVIGNLHAGGPDVGGVYELNFPNTDFTLLNTSNSGLPSSNILSMTGMVDSTSQDLWIGTTAGLTHWDANGDWTTYTSANSNLQSNTINDVAVSPDGNLMAVGTSNGFLIYDAAADSFVYYNSGDGLVYNEVNTVTWDTGGTVYVGTPLGLSVFDGSTFTNFNMGNGLSGNNVTALVYDTLPPQHRLAIGFGGQGVDFWDGATFTNINSGNSDLPNDNINDMAPHSSGLLFATSGGASLLDTGGLYYNLTTFNSNIPSNDVISVEVGNHRGNESIFFNTSFGPFFTDDMLAAMLYFAIVQNQKAEANGTFKAFKVNQEPDQKTGDHTYNVMAGTSTGLLVNNALDLGNPGGTPTVSGQVTFDGSTPVTSGFVILVETGWVTLNTCPINSDGTYTCDLENVPLCEGYDYYIIAHHPDPYQYMPTFYGNTEKWTDGIFFEACQSQANRNIILKPFPTAPNGNGTIRGQVVEGNWTGKASGTGDPIVGVDVYLQDKANSNLTVLLDTTDTQGIFEFNNVEQGSYSILVNAPGIPTDTLFTININAGGNTVDDLVVTVDSNLIHFQQQPSGIAVVEVADRFRLFPNPVEEALQLAFNLSHDASVAVALYDVTGQQSKQLFDGDMQEGRQVQRFNLKQQGIPAGIYLLHLTIDGTAQTHKIVVMD